MSRLFEALQQSETERSDSPAPQVPSVATELFQATENRINGFGEFSSVSTAVQPDNRLVCLTSGSSLAAENFRLLGLRLRYLQQSRHLKKILVTSTLAEEGKSLVAANLAITLARKEQQKILLLEGDLRRPVLAERFGLSKLPGLTEVLQSNVPLTQAIYELKGAKCWFFPAGNPPENPLELMQSVSLSGLLDHLTSFFDWIVIDSPPLVPLADTSLWSRLVDGVLLVAREGKTERRQLRKGLEMLDRSTFLGVVLNSCSGIDPRHYYQRYVSINPDHKEEAKSA
jgi:capsular exopolysaccharide synthesis family protein